MCHSLIPFGENLRQTVLQYNYSKSVVISYWASWGMATDSSLSVWPVREARAFRLVYSCSE